MEVSHTSLDKPTARDAWTALEELPQRVNTLVKKYESSNACDFEDFERQLHALFAQTECAVTEEALARHDVDLPFVFIDGEVHRRACRCAQTYLTAAGPVSVTRTLYRARRGERAVAALERKVGIVEGYWTPLAARQGAMLVSHLTPRDAEEVLATLGHMQPSKSSLDRLPKALSARWEAQREDFEATVREATVEVPGAARAVVVSLDGVMAPMRGGYREAGCATVSLVDGDGERAAQRAHGPDAGVEEGDPEDDGGRRGRGGARSAPGPRGGEDCRRGEGQLDVLDPCAARRGRAHRLLPRRRAPHATPSTPPTEPTPPRPRRSSRSIAIGCAMSLMGSTASFGRWSICARSIRATSESHRCWAISVAIATAWATLMPRPGDCPSAPASWRRRARLWSPNGSNAPACDGVCAAGNPF